MRRLDRATVAYLVAAFAMFCATASIASAQPSTARPQAANPALSEESLLARLTNPARQVVPLPTGTTVTQISSHDLAGGNADGGSYLPEFAPFLPPTYVRQVNGSFELADKRGPGCLVRIWTTASGAASGDTSSFGNLQLYFDGSRKPAVDVPAAAFFAGRDPRFPVPLVNDYLHSSGGNYSYIPFCFAHRLQVRVTGKLAAPLSYFQLTFLNARSGTPVQPFIDGRKAAHLAAHALAAPGLPPAGRPRVTAAKTLRPGQQLALALLRGPATVRYLRVKVRPFDIKTLNALTVLARFDGSARPQIRVPLAAMFGDGIEVRPIRSLGFGMNPTTKSGYLALPMPFRQDARISVKSAGAKAAVSVSAWTGPATSATRHLYGEQIVTQTQLGQDFPVLDADGSGQLASLVLDIRDPAGPLTGSGAGQWFMEGDERVYVDGLRSPSIYGTGTEDEFNGGWYYNQGPFTLPLNGAGPLGTTGQLGGGTQSNYRVFGDDGVIWNQRIRYGEQIGGNDDRLPATVKTTTFSYRGTRIMFPAERVRFGGDDVAAGHFTSTTLDAYFEGDHDGTISVSTVAAGGTYYFSPPAEASPEGFAASGIAFTRPVSFTLHVPRSNRGVVLRRLQDQMSSVPVQVTVDRKPAGIWEGAAFQGNPLKRWLESDFALPPRLTTGRSTIVVTLQPLHRGATATAYTLEAFCFGSAKLMRDSAPRGSR